MKKIFLLVSIVVLFAGCNEVPVMIPDFEVPNTNRVVLMEDLTGVRCPNCPKGAKAIENIIEKFEGKVVAVGIHGNFLTKPLDGEVKSKYDFRNPKSIELEEYLKPFLGKPSVQINRRYFDGELYTSVDYIDQWESYVEDELNRPQEMEIILGKNYNPDSRKLDINVAASPLINETGRFRISVYIIESKIIDPQETNNAIIEEYEHNHVLRDMLTAVTGDEFAVDLEKNKIYNKSYSYVIPQEFNADNMEVVVMVNRDKADDKSVLQAQAIKVK